MFNMVLKWLEKFKDEESKEPIGYVLQINYQENENVTVVNPTGNIVPMQTKVNYAVTNNPETLHTHWVAGDKFMLLCLDGATISINMSLVATFKTIPIQDYSDLLDLALVRKSASEQVLGIPIADVIRRRMNG